MKLFRSYIILFMIFLFSSINAAAQYESKLIDFSGSTLQENNIIIMGADFGNISEATYVFGSIPTDNAFEGATDGRGLFIIATPGQGLMMFGPTISLDGAAFIRCSIRTNSPNASIIIASLDLGPNKFASTNTSNNGDFFVGQYRRLSVYCTPGGEDFQPLIQVLNTSETEPLIAYLDNFEITPLKPGTYYNADFLDGDEMDPDTISTASEEDPSPNASPIPTFPPVQPHLPSPTFNETIFPSPTPTPTATSNPQHPVNDYNLNYSVGLDLPPAAKALEMVWIDPGSFQQGSSVNEKDHWQDEEPQHKVTLTSGFWMGKYEITQAQWRSVMGESPQLDFGAGDNYPIYNVSWNDCQEFIMKLNQMGLGDYRLPTEAEWEYVCRAGTSTRFHWGDDLDYIQIDDYAWFDWNHSTDESKQVGLKRPNAWGLYDMSGNVYEWCNDWYGEYPKDEVVTDPQGPSTGMYRVGRGGYWSDFPQTCRSSYRYFNAPDMRLNLLGFRLVKTSNH